MTSHFACCFYRAILIPDIGPHLFGSVWTSGFAMCAPLGGSHGEWSVMGEFYCEKRGRT